jgi:DNA-binding NarL/FixJ family response regulator
MYTAGEACNGQEVLEMVRAEHWDVLVLDLSMPVRGGLEVLHDVKQLSPALPVLILSMYPENQYGIRALRAGASGYMNKECALDELLTAIEKVVAGGEYVTPHLAERLAFELSGNLRKEPHELLSDREYDVMCMIGAGKSPDQIARELSLSVKTISTYRARVLQKLSLNKNAELIRYVLEHNLA